MYLIPTCHTDTQSKLPLGTSKKSLNAMWWWWRQHLLFCEELTTLPNNKPKVIFVFQQVRDCTHTTLLVCMQIFGDYFPILKHHAKADWKVVATHCTRPNFGATCRGLLEQMVADRIFTILTLLLALTASSCSFLLGKFEALCPGTSFGANECPMINPTGFGKTFKRPH